MAISQTKKYRMARKWLVIGGDASFSNFDQVIGRYDTEGEAKQNTPAFATVRRETIDEVKARMAPANS